MSASELPSSSAPLLDRALLDRVADVVERACVLVSELLPAPRVERQKHDLSPVTDIDLAVDRFLFQHLRSLLPSAGWLSEESGDDLSRLKVEDLWVVDPIDGTRGMIAGSKQFCISVALARRGQVRLAVVANPNTSERFFALRDQGAWDEQGRRLKVRSISAQPLQIAVSSSELRYGMWGNIEEPLQREVGSLVSLELSTGNGLTLKMVQVATGEVDGTVTPWPRGEWDAAAADLIVTEAGGRTAQVNGEALSYNHRSPRFSGIVCSSDVSWSEMQAVGRIVAARREEVRRRWEKKQLEADGDGPSSDR